MLDEDEIKQRFNHMVINTINEAKIDTINDYSINIIYYIRKINPNKPSQLKPYYLWKWWRRRSLDRIVNFVYQNQQYISWVDIHLYTTSKNRTNIIVNLVYKKDSRELDFHACYNSPFMYERGVNEKFDLNKEMKKQVIEVDLFLI